MNTILMILGIFGIILQYITRKQEEKNKSNVIVFMQYMVMSLIIIFGAYAQFKASQSDLKYKNAVYQVDVLSKMTESFIPVLEDTALIQNNILIVKNYLSFEKAKNENPELKSFMEWEKLVDESQIDKLTEVKKALNRIKSIAANIAKLHIEHPNVIPKEMLDWNNVTLQIDFNEIEIYFDPYSPKGQPPKKSVLEYQKMMGKAFGVAIGNIRKSSELLTNGF
ncbi:MAG: hypothetical protein RBR54_08770 [Sulfurimonas sp.]|jgi:hypothetical protein|nr:hypothetical protein [Sulfurimonas sp.]